MMQRPHKSTYTVTIRIENNFHSDGEHYVARDSQQNWRAYWKCSRVKKDYPNGLTAEQLVCGLFHADEIESFREESGVICAVIRQW